MRQRSENRKRTQLVGVRLSEDEHQVLATKAAAVGVSCADLMRSAGLGKKVASPKVDREGALTLAKELRAVGVNLNQLAKVANASGHVEVQQELADLREVLDRIWRSLS